MIDWKISFWLPLKMLVTWHLFSMISSLNKEGVMGVVLPHGVFLEVLQREIRKVLESDLLEAVIGLPSSLFYGTGIPPALLIINKRIL